MAYHLQMLLLCAETVAIPLKLFFSNILSTGIYPNIWKLANVFTKKMTNSLLKTIDPSLCYVFVVNVLKSSFLITYITF